eukprot:comp21803_c0_seq1/m.31026 comp21803_c0_seq1/g.31026  ORF comp21803_c0_seq1/g.31026 comp21803_c0_seq1/m.31026 type:complete len:502 (-) comp21803_c0_seq1:400-1905(-)
MSKAIGLDIGSNNCCVAVAKDDGTSDVITNEAGYRTTPAFVSFLEEEQEVGLPAKQQLTRNAQNTVFAAKHMIGRRFKALDAEDLQKWQCNVIDRDGEPVFEVDYKEEMCQFTAVEITTMLVAKMKETAEHFLGSPVSECVITVPAYFDDTQRKATLEACRKAGLEVLRAINEPVAAALVYGVGQKDAKEERLVLVLDIGASSVDTTLLRVSNGIYHIVKTAHHTGLGGSGLDERLAKYFADEFSRKTKLNPLSNKRAASKLRAECERAVQVLSTSQQTMVTVESLMEGIDLHSSINRLKFESICNDLFVQMLNPVHAIITENGFSKSDISQVILTGGTTKIPRLQTMLADYFGEGTPISASIAPDEVVACGAALQAQMLSGHVHIYEHNDYIDCMGLASSIGVEDAAGNFVPVLLRSTPLPVRQVKTIASGASAQAFVLRLYEGDDKVAKNNRLLCELAATIPAGVEAQLSVTAREDGGCHVTLTNSATGERLCDHNLPH